MTRKTVAVSPATQSMYVVVRAAFKLSAFLAAASLHAAMGHGFVRHLTPLIWATALCCLVLGRWRREHVFAPHYTHFDEAVWFLMLGLIIRSCTVT